MTRSTRAVLLLAVLVALSSVAAVWTAAGTDGAIQEEPQAASDSFQVENLSAPPSVVQGETVTVTATVSYAANETADDGATEEDETATEEEAETTATETEADEEAAANETETEAAANETETEAAEATDQEGETQLVEYRVNGDVVDRQEVTLASGESTEVSFEFDASAVDPGIYVHGIYTDQFGEQGSIVVTQMTGEPTADDNETADGNETDAMNETETPGADEEADGEATETETPTATETETPTATETETETPEDEGMEPEEFFTSPSFDVQNVTAPSEVTSGETVNVTAEVFYPSDAAGDAANGADETEMAQETETPEPTETATEADEEAAANETETEAAANETETEAAGTETAADGADDENLTQTVQFRVQGDVVDEQNVTLAPGESTTVSFEFDTSEVETGIYVNSVFTRDYGEVMTLVITNETAAEDGATETPMDNATDEEEGTETPAGEEEGTETPGDEDGTEEAEETPTATEAEAGTATET